jgi:hypothetical protein
MTSTPIVERGPTGTESTASRTGRARALFLIAALLSFAASVVLYFGGDETEGIFVGLWVPSILALGTFLAPTDGRR